MGDSFRSIHPVAGQGWNLGIKDIQSFLNLLETKSLNSENFNSIYYSRRKFESYLYFSFTEIINKTFQLNTPLSNFFGVVSLKTLKRLSFLRSLFIRQAMGINKILN
jgi:2-octaprenyl-6-methoxyphenol hydroxylase